MPDDSPRDNVKKDAQQDNPNAQPANPQVPPNKPDAQATQPVTAQDVQTEVNTLKDRVRRGEWWMIGLTGAIAFFALCSAIVGYFQWRVMSGQLAEMKSGGVDTHTLADTTAKSFDIQKRLTEGNNEAICRVVGNPRLDEDKDDIAVNNSGKINAIHVRAHIEVALKSLPTLQPLSVLSTLDINEDEILANNAVVRTVQLGLTPAAKRRIMERQETVVVSGTLQYDNGFGSIRNSPFCSALVVSADPKNASMYLPECHDVLRVLNNENKAAQLRQEQEKEKAH